MLEGPKAAFIPLKQAVKHFYWKTIFFDPACARTVCFFDYRQTKQVAAQLWNWKAVNFVFSIWQKLGLP